MYELKDVLEWFSEDEIITLINCYMKAYDEFGDPEIFFRMDYIISNLIKVNNV